MWLRFHRLWTYWGGKEIEVGLGYQVGWRLIWSLTSLSKHFMMTEVSATGL
jgi:hypothetical protein